MSGMSPRGSASVVVTGGGGAAGALGGASTRPTTARPSPATARASSATAVRDVRRGVGTRAVERAEGRGNQAPDRAHRLQGRQKGWSMSP